MALITLQHTDINSGNKVAIPCSLVVIGYNKTSTNNPNANYSATSPSVRVQSQSIANPMYTLQSIQLDPGISTIGGFSVLTPELYKQFFTLSNDDSDPILLNVTYGDSTSWTSLNKYSGSRVSDIPVTVSSNTDIKLSVKDSNKAYMPIIGSIVLLETLKV